jgi:hypothetical protein
MEPLTQPPEIINDTTSLQMATSGATEVTKRKSKLKSNRHSSSAFDVTQDQVAAALAASRARVADAAKSSHDVHKTSARDVSNPAAGARDAAFANDVVDLTASPKKNSAKSNTTMHSKKTPKPAADTLSEVTPTPLQNQSSAVQHKELPKAPALSNNERERAKKRLKIREDEGTAVIDPNSKLVGEKSDNVARVSLDSAQTKTKPAETKKKKKKCAQSESAKIVEVQELNNKAAKASRVSLDSVDTAKSKLKEMHKASDNVNKAAPAETKKDGTESKSKINATKASDSKPAAASKSSTQAASSTTQSNAPAQPAKMKKRSFHDQILYTMLTSSKPYTLKSLAKDCNTTTEALNHAMLSFLDKQLVLSKDFPSKKGEKKLYWANPISESEMNGKSAIAKEFGKLLASKEEMAQAVKTQSELTRTLRGIGEELRPLSAIPSLKQLEDEISSQEKELQQIQSEINAIRQRMEKEKEPTKPLGPSYNRFNKAPSKPRDKTSLKRSINHYTCEYKKRKRTCMDFVENLADAMEKKVKDAAKTLDLETDELEWGCWKDCGSGKIYGSKKGKGVVGEEDVTVRIPAKYDV